LPHIRPPLTGLRIPPCSGSRRIQPLTGSWLRSPIKQAKINIKQSCLLQGPGFGWVPTRTRPCLPQCSGYHRVLASVVSRLPPDSGSYQAPTLTSIRFPLFFASHRVLTRIRSPPCTGFLLSPGTPRGKKENCIYQSVLQIRILSKEMSQGTDYYNLNIAGHGYTRYICFAETPSPTLQVIKRTPDLLNALFSYMGVNFSGLAALVP